MKLRNGFIARDSYGDWSFFKERPAAPEWSSLWGDGGLRLPKEMFEDLPECEWRESLRQILNGKIIFPLPELEVGAKVFVSRDLVPAHFSHFDDDGNLWVFSQGRTSWTTEKTDTFDYWELPDGSQD
jgi:hypothetical protein